MPAPLPTLIEPFVAQTPSRPVALDAWRWAGIPTLEAYARQVLAAEAARASRRA